MKNKIDLSSASIWAYLLLKLVSRQPTEMLWIVEREKDDHLVMMHTPSTHQGIWCENLIIWKLNRVLSHLLKKMTKNRVCKYCAHVERQRYIWVYLVLEISPWKLEVCFWSLSSCSQASQEAIFVCTHVRLDPRHPHNRMLTNTQIMRMTLAISIQSTSILCNNIGSLPFTKVELSLYVLYIPLSEDSF